MCFIHRQLLKFRWVDVYILILHSLLPPLEYSERMLIYLNENLHDTFKSISKNWFTISCQMKSSWVPYKPFLDESNIYNMLSAILKNSNLSKCGSTAMQLVNLYFESHFLNLKWFYMEFTNFSYHTERCIELE